MTYATIKYEQPYLMRYDDEKELKLDMCWNPMPYAAYAEHMMKTMETTLNALDPQQQIEAEAYIWHAEIDDWRDEAKELFSAEEIENTRKYDDLIGDLNLLGVYMRNGWIEREQIDTRTWGDRVLNLINWLQTQTSICLRRCELLREYYTTHDKENTYYAILDEGGVQYFGNDREPVISKPANVQLYKFSSAAERDAWIDEGAFNRYGNQIRASVSSQHWIVQELKNAWEQMRLFEEKYPDIKESENE